MSVGVYVRRPHPYHSGRKFGPFFDESAFLTPSRRRFAGGVQKQIMLSATKEPFHSV